MDEYTRHEYRAMMWVLLGLLLAVVIMVILVEWYSKLLAALLYGVFVLLPFLFLFFVLREFKAGPDPNNEADNRPICLQDVVLLLVQVIVPLVVTVAAFGPFISRLEMTINAGFDQTEVPIYQWGLFAIDNTLSAILLDAPEVFDMRMSTVYPTSIVSKCCIVLFRALIEIYMVGVIVASVFGVARNGLTFKWTY